MRDSYWTGRETGQVNDMASMIGAMDRRAEQQARDRTQATWKEPKPKENDSRQDDTSTVICTELYRQGQLSRADYLQGLDYTRKNLTERHYRGYHAWAVSVVPTMRRSKRATAFWRFLVQARADHIAYLYGDAMRQNRLGAFLCTIGHPVCYMIGGFVDQQDWQSLYHESKQS